MSLVPHREPTALDVIATAIKENKIPDVEVLHRLLDFQERVQADQRRTAFMAALARLTDKLVPIAKGGQSHHGRYSTLEDIDRAIRPLIGAEGFSMSFDTQPVDAKSIRVICKLSHADGHSESKQIDLPLDTSGSKNGAQSVISTVAYGRRALTKMFFNLIETGEDTDGNDPAAIDGDQVKTIETLLADAKQDKGQFLKLIAGAESIEKILRRDYDRCVMALQTKIRAQQK